MISSDIQIYGWNTILLKQFFLLCYVIDALPPDISIFKRTGCLKGFPTSFTYQSRYLISQAYQINGSKMNISEITFKEDEAVHRRGKKQTVAQVKLKS